jgi:glyoxylase I family protein
MIPSLVQVDHIGFVVPNREEATKFFVEALGAKVVFEHVGPFTAEDQSDGSNTLWDEFRIHRQATLDVTMLDVPPGIGIEIYEIAAPDQRTEHIRQWDIGAPHLSFSVRDLEAAKTHLEQFDGVVTCKVGEMEMIKWIKFETPWGLMLELDEWSQPPYHDWSTDN